MVVCDITYYVPRLSSIMSGLLAGNMLCERTMCFIDLYVYTHYMCFGSTDMVALSWLSCTLLSQSWRANAIGTDLLDAAQTPERDVMLGYPLLDGTRGNIFCMMGRV